MAREVLVVNEKYGPVLQGEGVSLGVPSMFLRLGGCNLTCWFCDTKYTWKWDEYDSREELHPTPIDDIVQWMHDAPVQHLVITGGEPLLQDRMLGMLLHRLTVRGVTVEIETNGTRIPTFSAELVRQFNVSPKLPSSGNAPSKADNPDAIRWFQHSNRAYFKFVITRPEDVSAVAVWNIAYRIDPDRILLMPEGVTRDAQVAALSWLEPIACASGFRVTPRLHVMVHDDRRGV